MAICQFDCELFSDAINERGIAARFWSLDSSDGQFGSCCPWENAECSILGGVGNLPYDVSFIQTLGNAFEAGVAKTTLFFRAFILAGGKSYAIEDLLHRASAKGRAIVHMSANNVGFKNQSILLGMHQENYLPNPLRNQKLTVCVWVNPAYVALGPPPVDVEDAIATWVLHSCRSLEEVVISYDVIRHLFPIHTRSSKCALDKLTPLSQCENFS